jgi:glycine/D-amino acid oxidase-like deaminating enzyme
MPRTLIVGGGVAGASTAFFLGRRGERDVVLLEREPLCGVHSSGKNAAILRTLTEDPVTTALGRESAGFLNAPPEGFSSVPLVERTGLLLTADAQGAPELERWFEASGTGEGCGERVEPRVVRELAPHHGAEAAVAFWYPDEGRIDIAALMAGFERGARGAGVAVRTGARVARLLERGGRVRGVRLETGEELEAETTVLAAGGWAGRLGAEVGSRLTLVPRRRHLLTTAPDPRVDPGWPVVWHQGAEPFYARPESGGLLVCGCDQAEVDPDRCAEDPAVRELIAERVASILPSFADARVASFWCGMRTFTPDGCFAIGRDPDVEGLAWVAGLGGHGMVCAAGVGELAAALLAGDEPPDRLAEAAHAFDPVRFSAEPAASG